MSLNEGILHCYDGERGARLSEILAYLHGVYCGPTAIEVSHMTVSDYFNHRHYKYLMIVIKRRSLLLVSFDGKKLNYVCI